jgi:D-Tyr-tRNAtyr deacylase
MKSFWKSLSAIDLLAVAIVFYAFVLLPTVLIQGQFPMQAKSSPAEQAVVKINIMAGSSLITGLKVETGLFQEHMLVEIHNDGPVTISLESRSR